MYLETTMDTCGGELTALNEEQLFASPGYPTR